MWGPLSRDKIDDFRKKLLTDGAALVQGVLNGEEVASIKAELSPWLSQVNFNQTPGYALVGASKWIYHLGMCSGTGLRAAVDERLLTLLDSVFGEEAIAAEIQAQESYQPLPLLKFHSDRSGGIICFVFLTDMTESNGQFAYIPGTQGRNEYFWIPEDELKKVDKSVVKVVGKAGDALLFDQDLWHTRFTASAGDRLVLWLLYQPKSRTELAVDHLLRQSLLDGLSERQLRALGVGMPAFKRAANLSFVGKPFGNFELKSVLRYLLQQRNVTFRKRQETTAANYSAKMKAPSAKIRAPL